MKNKKILFVLLLMMMVLLVAATVLYDRLGSGFEQDNLIVEGTTASTTTASSPGGAAGTTAAAEETEPETVPAPDFTVYDKDGNAVRLSDYFGKPIVLNFWASWCGPCKSEMPEFNAKYQELGDEVTFLMVNATTGRETKEKAQAYLDASDFSFPVLFDTDGTASITWEVYSLPSTYFIDRNGHIVAYATGAISGSTLQRGIDMIS